MKCILIVPINELQSLNFTNTNLTAVDFTEKTRLVVEMQDITNKCVMHYIKGGTTDKMRPHRTHLLHATHHISFPLGMLLRAELSSSTFYGKK